MAFQNRLMLFDVLSVQRQRGDYPDPQASAVRKETSDTTEGHHGETCCFSRVVYYSGEGVAVAAADCATGRSCI